jgi:chromosome segregation ATPase
VATQCAEQQEKCIKDNTVNINQQRDLTDRITTLSRELNTMIDSHTVLTEEFDLWGRTSDNNKVVEYKKTIKEHEKELEELKLSNKEMATNIQNLYSEVEQLSSDHTRLSYILQNLTTEKKRILNHQPKRSVFSLF